MTLEELLMAQKAAQATSDAAELAYDTAHKNKRDAYDALQKAKNAVRDKVDEMYEATPAPVVERTGAPVAA